jgi:integrase/recombinase XerD
VDEFTVTKEFPMKMSKAIPGFILVRTADGYSPNTLAMYEWALNLISEGLGDPEIEVITTEQLQRFYVWLRTEYVPTRFDKKEHPLAPRSVENIWTAMRSFFNWAVEEFGLKTRPDSSIKRPKYKPAEIVPLTEEEIRAILKACERTKPSKLSGKRPGFSRRRKTAYRDAAIVLVLLDTGIRVSELTRLKVGNVNLDAGEVFIEPWGTGRKTKSRTVFLGKSARKAVWRYLTKREDVRQDEPLFLTDDNLPMTRSTVLHLLVTLGKAAGIKGVHPHRFRHTFAIMYLRNQGDVFSLQRQLGHESLDMVQHYLAIAKSDIAEAHRLASPADRLRL